MSFSNPSGKGLAIRAGVFSLLFTFAYFATRESKADRDRKPAAITNVANYSFAHADSNAALKTSVPYKTRLDKLLASERTADLDILAKNDIAIVLDRRQNDQVTTMPFFGTSNKFRAILYKKARILALQDDGTDNYSSFSGTSNAYDISMIIHRVAQNIDKNGLETMKDITFVDYYNGRHSHYYPDQKVDRSKNAALFKAPAR